MMSKYMGTHTVFRCVLALLYDSLSVRLCVRLSVRPSVTHELNHVLAPFLTKFGISKGLKQFSITI